MSRMEFDFRVAADHPSLPGHFPGRPLVPGVLLLDHVLQAVSRLAGQDVTRLRQVKFTSALWPGEQACGSCEIEGGRVAFRVVTRRDGAEIPIAEGVGTLYESPPP
jgi:3-hydroxymyristoyl/3-hydroxydecanoyl-(acyl carrier protein) dehydratase